MATISNWHITLLGKRKINGPFQQQIICYYLMYHKWQNIRHANISKTKKRRHSKLRPKGPTIQAQRADKLKSS